MMYVARARSPSERAGSAMSDPREELGTLRARRIGIDTQHEFVVFMRADCGVCRAEGFQARARVVLRVRDRSIIATLHQVRSELLAHGDAGLSEAAWRTLDARDGEPIGVSHPEPLESLRSVRAKVYGIDFDEPSLINVIADVMAGRYSEVHLAAFITACVARGMVLAETTALTRAMVSVGDRLSWSASPVADKHCIGGLPGNRTTPIVVAIVAAYGVMIPKTSSRAITSPAGTADTMETLAPVELDLPVMRRVVEQEGGCIVWGGAVRLSPADDILIRVERPLDLDSEGQLVASVISKKAAAGATHLVLDLPIGVSVKVRSQAVAIGLAGTLAAVAGSFGIQTRVVFSDGTQPVGRGVGPALEAWDVLAVLRGEATAPVDLRERALELAGALLELAGAVQAGGGVSAARQVLASGAAWRKFQAICDAQGGMRTPPVARWRYDVVADRAGRVVRMDNRRIARIAKLAGAPEASAAGLKMHVHIGDRVESEAPLFSIHAESPGELAYSLEYARRGGAVCIAESDSDSQSPRNW